MKWKESVSNFKAYIAPEINDVADGQTHRSVEKNKKRNSHKYAQPIFDKGANVTQWEKASSTNGAEAI